MSTILRLFVLFLVVISGLAEYLSLDGHQWVAINHNKTIKANAKVPGSIYSDLRRAGVLKENIFKEDNDVKYRWVSYENWTYERTFNVDSTLLAKYSVNLLAKGMDTISTVYINDKIVGKTDNQFIRYKFDVKKDLKVGENKIRVEFTSAPIYAKQKFNEYMKKYGYDVPPDCTAGAQNGECHYNFIRKMQSSFSWDWGPAFPTQGIWKPIGIEAYDKAIIRDITVKTTPEPKNRSEWTLTVNTFIESTTDKEFDAILSIKLEDRHDLVSNLKVKIIPQKDGSAHLLSIIPIRNITIWPWYPNGVSKDLQKLYKLEVLLKFPNSQELTTQTKRIGFRTIELIQTPIKPQGLTFHFQVNGDPFFAKGTNWIPAHLLMEELTPEYIRHLMSSAKEANINMMRVWGGGVYESDLFYELADEMGIMIWQDFMFACALYPTDKDFLDIVVTEVSQQVRRLQHHPSIAIWAGNNENEVALAGPWYSVVKKNETLYRKDYIELYINKMKPTILSLDTTRPFVSSSPSNGLEDEKERWVAKNPGDERYGDVHYYNYNIKLWDWKSFPSPKFASEYGFQSYPSLEAFSEVLDQKELTFPVSKAIDHRQHHGGGDKVMEDQAARYFKLPSKGGADRLDDMIYLSQITQAMAMKTETEFYRRNREIDPKTGKGNTMGALYWQINDVWQAPTWASIEFGGKWKLLHNYAKNFLDNLLVSPYEDTNQTLKVKLVRDDYHGDIDFVLTIKVYNWSQNDKFFAKITTVKTHSFSAPVVYTQSIPELLKEAKCVDRTQCVLSFEVNNKDRDLKANNFMLLSEPKNSKIINPNIKLSAVKKNQKTGSLTISLTSHSVAPFVALDFKLGSGIKGHFSDNGFFMFDKTTTVEFYPRNSSVTEQQIRDNLTIKTVTDIK